MSLFAIGDTHLSLSCDKPMDIFNGWSDYVERLEENWKNCVGENDTVVINGDFSWAMTLEQAYEDFKFINALPGKKLISKGNHDYWWSTKNKMDKFLLENHFDTVNILHNNAYIAGDFAVCGTRGWFFDAQENEQTDKKVLLREAGRLKMSIDEAKKTGLEPIVFLHYPPLTQTAVCHEIYDVLIEEGIKRCFYGHLHSASTSRSVNSVVDGISFALISSDFLGFTPRLIEKY
ncbi:MAG: metallophosphoesterase [Clostridiales bacterium]|nr:metallophosphoesterase [Clostridiales bacterium]